MIKGKLYLFGFVLKVVMCLGLLWFWIYGFCVLFSNGIIDVDVVVCILSDDWFLFVLFFVGRCNKKVWLKFYFIYDIVKFGCYVVLIGFKLGDNEDVEW